MLKHIPLVLYSCILTHFILKCAHRLLFLSKSTGNNLLLYYTDAGYFILGEDSPKDKNELAKCLSPDAFHTFIRQCTSMSPDELVRSDVSFHRLTAIKNYSYVIPVLLNNLYYNASDDLKRKSFDIWKQCAIKRVPIDI